MKWTGKNCINSGGYSHQRENSAQYSDTQTKKDTLGQQVLVVLGGEAGQQKAQDGGDRARHQEWKWPVRIEQPSDGATLQQGSLTISFPPPR